jgi:phosphocarrier protein HPr
MPERTAIVGSAVGLHARPAAVFVQAAAALAVPVGIARPGGEPVSARSILSVLSLEAHGGDTVVLSAEGEGAQSALDSLAALLATDLDAE